MTIFMVFQPWTVNWDIRKTCDNDYINRMYEMPVVWDMSDICEVSSDSSFQMVQFNGVIILKNILFLYMPWLLGLNAQIIRTTTISHEP